jgi:hypothetical protein
MEWILSIIGFFVLMSIADYLDKKWKKFLNKFSKKEKIEDDDIKQVIKKLEKQKETLKPKQTKTENKPKVNIFENNNKIIQKKIYNKEKVSYKLLHKNIIPYLNFKGIYKFYHFTDVKNLKSIIQHGGLYSWYGLEARQINSSLSSNQLSRELDTRYNLQDYIRLSFGSYHPMSSRLIHQERKELVWLEISLEVACFEQTLFSDINATDNNVKIEESLDFLKTIDLDVFKHQYRDLDYNAKKKYQAEILVKKFLPIKYITNIDTLRKEKNL